MLATTALLLHGLIPSAPIGDAVANGPHFRVTAHFADDRIAKDALAAAEATWPLSTELFGEITVAKDAPFEIHLYRNAADYESAEGALTHGKFKRNLSFTSDETLAAHVALQPDLSDDALAKIGLTLLTREQIAHEAVHVACDHAWSNHRTLPTWFTEGSAMWTSEQTMKKGGWIRDPLDDPTLSTEVVRVKALATQKKLPAISAVLDDKIGELENHQRYALWLAAFRILHDGKHAAAFGQIVDAAHRTGGGAEHASKVAQAARAALGGDAGLAAIDAELAAYAHDVAPHWDEVFRSLATNGDAWAQTAFPDLNAMAWHTEDVGAERFDVSGEVEILAGAAQQMNLLLGRTEHGFVQISFTAGYGVDAFEFDDRRLDDAAWKKLGTAKVATLRVDHASPFKVHVTKTKIHVDLDGKPVLDVDSGDHPLKGATGLGAQAHSAGLWRKVVVKKT